jgi:hypothetical protein
MPAAQSRKQLTSEELQEFPITGPFGGVQSELPLTEIENYGFSNTLNVLFRQGRGIARPSWTALTPLPSPSNEPILAFADFFNANGVHIQCVITPTRLIQWEGASSTWQVITGAPFTGSSSDLWAWDVIGQKLCFSQGADIIWYWDGIAAGYLQTNASAPACKHLAEIELHLVALNTLESGTAYPQRYHWSGAGDPTDWTSFNSGINDELVNLGPGNGLIKLGQYGFGFHDGGIVLIQPTGVGTDPFNFQPIINASIGLICPYSLDHFDRDGMEQAVYVARDNIYVFNQSAVYPIGDQPISGGRQRLGARTRIFADLASADPSTVYGFVTNSINGQIFNAYWLVIPMVSVWVYNFDEGNWTVFTYQNTVLTIGKFTKAGVPRIEDLIGAILAQNWTPATLVGTNPFEGFALGFSNGTVGYVDFTNYSELGCSISSGKHIFGDRRHIHAVKKFRLVVEDKGPVTYTVVVSNEQEYSETQIQTLGTGSGDVLSFVFGFNVTGLRISWTVSAPPNQPAAFVEFAPMYNTSGEQRGGSADAN